MAGDGPVAENTISERLLSVSGSGRTCFDRSGSFSDLAWGAATSAYQIEGAANSGGKGPHIWDIYTAQPGHVFEQHTGEEACDHYHRYHEDVQIMKEIGLKAYRFSIDWSRVIPEGTGKVNEEGLAFYDALINELLENGIEPYITLYHWELPYEIYKRGGWMNPQIVEWFGEYAKLIAELFRCCGSMENRN
ncbi:Beta-glucosidase A [uncultured Blautia sp.]|nr:family 1 glycosylhydrolase [uncultured Blautia sp.]SCH98352.1 Beta-glucosidase A [uncultured Blautia sp.]